MKAKKIIAILIFCLVSALVFAGCGKKDEPAETPISSSASSGQQMSEKDTEKTTEEKTEKDKDKDKEKEDESKKDASPDRPGDTTPRDNTGSNTYNNNKEKETEKPTQAPVNPEEQVTEDEPEAHQHSYSGRVTKAATCTSQGIMTYTCSCGDYYTEYLPAEPHDIVSVITQQPSCGSQGVLSYQCANCGLVTSTEVIPATGNHSWAPVYASEQHTAYICSCGARFDTRDEWVAHSNASGDGHGSCSTQTYSVSTGNIDHYECSVCGQRQ